VGSNCSRLRKVLRIGQFQVLGAELVRHADDAVDVVDVHAVDHHVHHHRPALALDDRGDAVLQLEGLGVREEVVHLARRVLERELHMVQPGGAQARGALGSQADTRGQQVAVVAQAARLGDDDFEIVTQQRLAAGQAQLHRAELAAFAQHAQPVIG
jgi:uncharacterized protein YggL (DUF469 family)